MDPTLADLRRPVCHFEKEGGRKGRETGGEGGGKDSDENLIKDGRLMNTMTTVNLQTHGGGFLRGKSRDLFSDQSSFVTLLTRTPH